MKARRAADSRKRWFMRVPRCRFWMSGESTPSRGVAGNPWIPRSPHRPAEGVSFAERADDGPWPLPHGGSKWEAARMQLGRATGGERVWSDVKHEVGAEQ